MNDITQMNNPFIEEKYPDEMEKSLVELAQQGQKEALIKMIAKLSTFKGESKFRTWLYRIVMNHIINMKKGSIENMITTFDEYGKSLDAVQNAELPSPRSVPVDLNLLVEEAKIGCMTGMLLCLNREQRLIYILGELLSVSDAIGSELLEISKANFRKKLSRARKDLYNFMNEKCSLVKQSNPCRCVRKTKGFIEFGYVDPDNLIFTQNYYGSIRKVSPQLSQELEDMIDIKYAKLFREHPFLKPKRIMDTLNEMISDNKFIHLLNLNESMS